jgi:hypothetical protein
MRRSALSIAVLLGIASLAAGDARAAPTVAARVTIESAHTVLVGGKRHRHHGFHRDRGFHRDKSFARHHHGFHRGRAIHKGFAHRHGFSRGHHHSNAFVAKRIGKGQFVLIRPTYELILRHPRLTRPLIRNGSFVRHPYW